MIVTGFWVLVFVKSSSWYRNLCYSVGTGQASLFGNTQNKLGGTLGTIGTFGATAFNSGTNSLGFGAAQQPVGKTNQTVVKVLFLELVSSFNPQWLSLESLWDLHYAFPQHLQTQMRQLHSRPFSSSSSVFLPIPHTEILRFSGTSLLTPRKKKRYAPKLRQLVTCLLSCRHYVLFHSASLLY